MKRIITQEELDAVLSTQDTFVLFKHSTTCPISAAARDQAETFEQEHPEVPVYEVFVIENRELSHHIAEQTGIPHQSPQAFVFSKGDVVWNASHGGITKEALASASST